MNRSILAILAVTAVSMLAGCGSIGAGQTSFGDEDFTIVLKSFNEIDHNAEAERYLKLTQQQAGWSNLFVVHQEGASALLWGKYRTVAAAQDDLKTAKAWKTAVGMTPYQYAIITSLPGRENYGPPNLNLVNAQGAYSYMVAVFMDVPQQNLYGHRESAVEYCQALRKKNWEAYYYHDGVRSCVTIGTFDKNAIQKGYNPAPGASGPGADTSLFRPTVEINQIVDPKMLAVQKSFPHLLVNGKEEVVVRGNSLTNKPTVVPSETYPIAIPARPINAPRVQRHDMPPSDFETPARGANADPATDSSGNP